MAEKIRGAVDLIARVKDKTANPAHQANLQWLGDNFRFTLLLDEVGRKIEPAYRLKERWLRGEIDDAKLKSEAEPARRQLASAPEANWAN